MNDRATFGDCATAASRHLGAPVLRPSDLVRPSPASLIGAVQEYNYGLHRVLKAMTRYLSGIVSTMQSAADPVSSTTSRWLRASVEAKEAAKAAMLNIPQLRVEGRVRLQHQPTSHITQHLDAAASAIAASRDLLFTHFETRPDGSLQPQSGWVPVIESVTVNQALLATVAGWSRQIVAEGTYLTSFPALRGVVGATERVRLESICGRLSELVWAVDAAEREDPVRDDAVAQLHAIPGNFLQPQLTPDRAATISGLCQGIAESCERVRHAFTTAIPDAVWSPELSAESFSQTAVYATTISQHCQMVQRALAARAADLGATSLSQQLKASAHNSWQASQAWLRAAHDWYHIKTDAISETSPATAEAADLMIWTGRLAHADPDWAPSFGPSHDARLPHQLAPEVGDITHVMTAIHEASTTLVSIAAADYERIRVAAGAGRLLAPNIQAGRGRHANLLFVRAPKKQGESLLGAYGRAGTTSVKSAAKTAAIIAVAAKHGGRRQGTAVIQAEGKMPGPVERRLVELGVTDPGILERGAVIDQSARQVIDEAAQETAPQRWHTAVAGQKAVADTSKVASQLLTPTRPRAPHPRHLSSAKPERELEAGR